jgi:hypothetical protein
MVLAAPKLDPIDPESILFGSLHISWSQVPGTKAYYVFRDDELITNVAGWHPYAIVDNGNTYFDDSQYQNGSLFYYSIISVNDNERSILSNCQRVKVKIPAHILIDSHFVQEAAYYESQSSRKFDDKIWTVARLQLILEHTFPQRDIEYLKIKVKSIPRDLPEFSGLFNEPIEAEIRERARTIYNQNRSQMSLDWEISEKELVIKKIQELLEFESTVR